MNARKGIFQRLFLRSKGGDLKEILHTTPEPGKMMLEKKPVPDFDLKK